MESVDKKVNIRINKLRTELTEFCLSTDDRNIKRDCSRVENALKIFHIQFLKKERRHQKYVNARRAQNPNSNVAEINNHPIPILFFNNKPILKLFMYNIYFKADKNFLTQYLSSKGAKNFRVVHCQSSKGSTTAQITCANLESSFMLQSLSCLNKLSRESSRKARFMRLRPNCDILDKAAKRKLNKTQTNTRTCKILSILGEPMASVIGNSYIVSKIAQYFQERDNRNFSDAFASIDSFSRLKVDFDSLDERYRGEKATSSMLADAKFYRLSTIRFSESAQILPPSFILLFLHTIINTFNLSNERKQPLDWLDLSGITLTDEVINIIKVNFQVSSFTIGEFHCRDELNIPIPNLHKFSIINSQFARLKMLTSENFNNLSSLSLIGCKKLMISYINEFIHKNQNLRELIITDCTHLDANLPSGSLIESIYLIANNIQIFEYTFSCPSEEVIIFLHDFPLALNESIKKLNFRLNSYCLNYLNQIIANSPNLEELNILEIGDYAELDLSSLSNLSTLKCNYHMGINESLSRLVELPLEDIKIINTLSSQDTKLFSARLLSRILRRKQKFKLEYFGHLEIDFHALARLAHMCEMLYVPDSYLYVELCPQ